MNTRILFAVCAIVLYSLGELALAQQDMSSMPGMSASPAPAAQQSSTYTPTVPPGSQLLTREQLDEHMRGLPPPVEDSATFSFSQFDLLEYRVYGAGSNTFTWDFVGWYGGDYHRLWIKSEGDRNPIEGVQGDLQLLYGRLISPFWDFQIGARFNGITGPKQASTGRGYVVIGFQGLWRANFDLEPSLYISNRGEVSAEFTGSVDIWLTQRIALQPRAEIQVSVQGDRAFGTRSGLTQTDLGLRLRYHFAREIAPYIGVTWFRKYGGTASLARAEGETDEAVAFVAGFQLWY